MRLTNKLCAQHLGWTFKKHWLVQGKRIPGDTGAVEEVIKNGVKLQSVTDLTKSEGHNQRERKYIGEEVINLNWNTKPSYLFGDNNILLKGIQQAVVLTNTIEEQSLPGCIQDSLERVQITGLCERSIKEAIMASNIFSADQEKLPKTRDNVRVGYNLRREYGIPNERKITILLNKLITECEKIAGRNINFQRRIIDQVNFNFTLPRNEETLLFRVKAEKFITSSRALASIKGKFDSELPNIYPLKSTISMPKEHLYSNKTISPFSRDINFHPHTIFVYFDNDKVANLHDVPVNLSQFQSRNMLKAFAVAAARAKQLYGNSDVEKLTRPIVVQSIQTDGRTFHFGVFQLNDLRSDDLGGAKNYWFHSSNLDLFEKCEYVSGRPKLIGFNKDVLRYLYAFYINS
ncbi:39S ribosomal protein L37, mitochondrial [Bactrocera neohumeralis]|uniref:39S ribosomal protein L37, mitochondrial n=1 Tax=Bactrocera tryoni TaxID=59916 RepID=UPI001A957BB3|nr:39S ribosomal protein L37, mitochondrial [Bactrocera tryoni]XP_050337621.1 39S ribosomal protein L37, mitochondrial [Bactrocera neohumeralis]